MPELKGRIVFGRIESLNSTKHANQKKYIAQGNKP
jgi:hypothetical protein